MKAVFLVLTIATILSVVTVSTACSHKEIEICDPKVVVNGTVKCQCFSCPNCPLGQGLSVECGSRVTDGTTIECRKCDEGVTYSNEHFPQKCKLCNLCGNKVTLQECTLESDRVCSEKECKEGFYYKQTTSSCEKCSPCCVGENYTSFNRYPKECSHMPDGQNCERTRKTISCPHKRSPTTSTPQLNPASTTQQDATNASPSHVRETKLPATSLSASRSSTTLSVSEENKEKTWHLLTIAVTSIVVCCLLLAIFIVVLCFCKRKTSPQKTGGDSNSSSMISVSGENKENHEMMETQPGSVVGSGAIKTAKNDTQSDRGKYKRVNQSYCDSTEQIDTQKPQGKDQERKPVFPKQDLETMLKRIPQGHRLRDLPAELSEEVETGLDNQTPGVNGWRQVGEAMSVLKKYLDIFVREYQKPDGSPTRALLNHITARHPNAMTRTFVEVLCKKERNDIAMKISEWDWRNETGAMHDPLFEQAVKQPLMTRVEH